jgi:hypothetical protein
LGTYADLFDDDLYAVAVTLHAKYSPQIAANMRPMDGISAIQATQKSSPPA